jgi:hypothetical protein
MNVVWALSVLGFLGVHGFGNFPSDAVNCDAPLNFWVDCANGNDGTGVGSSALPFKTIGYAQTLAVNSEVNNLEYNLIIKNGPCNEPTINPIASVKYTGNGATPPKITNGISYISVDAEYEDIQFSNLEIPVLNISMVAATQSYKPVFMGCKIGAGTIEGTGFYGVTTAEFFSCTASFQSISGTVSIYNGLTTVTQIGDASNLGFVLIQGGTISGTTVLGSQSSVRLIGTSAGSATFTSSVTGLNKPFIWYGSDTTALPTLSGVDIITSNNDCFSQTLFGSVAIPIGGTVAVTFACPINGNYVPALSYATGLPTTPGVSAVNSTGFTISGTVGTTIAWVVVKQV